MNKMADKNEWVPWYRRSNYKGNLSEEEKRILDSFRLEEKHPATSYEDLPNEVQGYINRIELELYDKTQDSVAGKAFILTLVAAFLVFLAYEDLSYNSFLTYVLGAMLFLFACFQYWRDWNKNANDLFPKEDKAPNRTDEGIQAEWELDYIVRLKRQKQPERQQDLGTESDE